MFFCIKWDNILDPFIRRSRFRLCSKPRVEQTLIVLIPFGAYGRIEDKSQYARISAFGRDERLRDRPLCGRFAAVTPDWKPVGKRMLGNSGKTVLHSSQRPQRGVCRPARKDREAFSQSTIAWHLNLAASSRWFLR
jgi:hypothetical protein